MAELKRHLDLWGAASIGIGATMASILGGSRAVFSMARQRVIPGILAKISKNSVPTNTVFISGAAIEMRNWIYIYKYNFE
jgi:amino acid transporter